MQQISAKRGQDKTRRDWVAKVIHLELYQKFKFDYTLKWYMYITEFVLEDETDKILWDFVIQTNHIIPARRPDQVIIYKKENLVDFAAPAYHRIKIKENEKKHKYLDLARKLLKNLCNGRVTVIPM